MNSDVPLQIFAKTPVAGQVKTRLVPACSAEQAAEIAKILLHACIEKTTQHWPGAVVVSVWPTSNHPFIKQLADDFGVQIVVQEAGNLGTKMNAGMQKFGYPTAILGSDAPHISAASLKRAYRLLETGSNVIGPSDDGGYYFIGLAQKSPLIFRDIEWGSEHVYRQTMVQAGHQQSFKILPSLNDIDTWQDLRSTVNLLPQLKHYLAHAGLLDREA